MKPKPKAAPHRALAIRFTLIVLKLLVVGCGMICAGFITGWNIWAVLSIPLIYVLAIIATILHELGHLFAAYLMGLQVQQFGIFPLKLARKGRRFHLRFHLDGRYDGLVGAFPLDDRRIRQRLFVFTAGGPAANLLAGLLCLVLALWADSAFPPQLPASKLGFLFDFAAIINFVYCLVNLIPHRFGAFRSDGSRLLGYCRRSQWAERLFMVLSLQAIKLSGTRPSDWDALQVEHMLALRDGSPDDLNSNLFGYYHALDAGDLHSAGACLDLAVALPRESVLVYPEEVVLEKAYFEAMHRNNVEARSWLAKAQGYEDEKQTRLRAEAAVLFVEGHYAEASARARAAIAEIANSIDRGGCLAESEWLQSLLVECQKQPTPAALQSKSGEIGALLPNPIYP